MSAKKKQVAAAPRKWRVRASWYQDGYRTANGRKFDPNRLTAAHRTLPFGTPDDVRKEMKWLVENGPKTGLFLGGSSSIAPGVPMENMKALVEGLNYYCQHGRN